MTDPAVAVERRPWPRAALWLAALGAPLSALGARISRQTPLYTRESLRALAAEPRILVSLATYNEAANIVGLIAEIHRYVPAADVLVIDDNSPDGTGDLVVVAQPA